MKTSLKFDRINVIEIIVVLILLTMSVGLKLLGNTAMIPIVGCTTMIAMLLLWALSAKKYTVGNIHGGIKWLMFIWAVTYKSMAIIFFIFERCGYAGSDIIGLVALILNIAYIVTTLCVRGWKECIIALIYRIILW